MTTSLSLWGPTQGKAKRISGKLLTQTNKFIGWRVDSDSKYLICKYQFPAFSNWIPIYIYSSLPLTFIPSVFVKEIQPFLLITNHPWGSAVAQPRSWHSHLSESTESPTSRHILWRTCPEEQKLCSHNEMIWFDPVRICSLSRLKASDRKFCVIWRKIHSFSDNT